MKHCECSEPGCSTHPGESGCSKEATTRVWRIDMWDYEGTGMCEECAADAMDSGCFTQNDPHTEEN